MSLQNTTESQKLKLQQFVDKSTIVHDGYYDYSKCGYFDAHTPVSIICPEHGVFLQLPRKHVSGQKCPKCSRRDANTYRIVSPEQFITRANKVHNSRYTYPYLVYKNGHDKIQIICPDHGIFEQTIHSHLAGHGCKQCSTRGKRTSVEPFNTEWFVARARAVFGDKYDYTKSIYNKSNMQVVIICPEHGEFKQVARDHLNGFGCKLCGLQTLRNNNARTKESFVALAKNVHAEVYNYDNVEYVNKDTKVIIGCAKHGLFEQTPHHHLYGQGCPKCQISSNQLDINSFVRSLGIDTALNDRGILAGNFEVDIAITSHKLGIEHNGMFWHSYDHPESKQEIYRHYDKLERAIKLGWSIVQINENEWLNKRDIVKSVLLNKLGLSKRLSARDYEVVIIANREAKEFYEKNHLQGHRTAFYHIALRSQDCVYACMSFSRHPKHQFELIRYAALSGYAVRGAASRLFCRFLRTINPKSIISYADRRYSMGSLYRTLGFDLLGITKPGYGYVRGNRFYSRQVFQKHKLERLLDIYDPVLSESTNMFVNGFRRLWDAGHWKFLWKAN